MSETPVCEVCGRERGYERSQCFVGESSGLVEEVACYRLGFERARAALSAAEKELETQKTLNAELHKGVCAGYADTLEEQRRTKKRLAAVESALGNLCGVLVDAMERRSLNTLALEPVLTQAITVYEGGHATLSAARLEASAASGGAAAPEAISESRPLDPPETA